MARALAAAGLLPSAYEGGRPSSPGESGANGSSSAAASSRCCSPSGTILSRGEGSTSGSGSRPGSARRKGGSLAVDLAKFASEHNPLGLSGRRRSSSLGCVRPGSAQSVGSGHADGGCADSDRPARPGSARHGARAVADPGDQGVHDQERVRRVSRMGRELLPGAGGPPPQGEGASQGAAGEEGGQDSSRDPPGSRRIGAINGISNVSGKHGSLQRVSFKILDAYASEGEESDGGSTGCGTPRARGAWSDESPGKDGQRVRGESARAGLTAKLIGPQVHGGPAGHQSWPGAPVQCAPPCLPRSLCTLLSAHLSRGELLCAALCSVWCCPCRVALLRVLPSIHTSRGELFALLNRSFLCLRGLRTLCNVHISSGELMLNAPLHLISKSAPPVFKGVGCTWRGTKGWTQGQARTSKQLLRPWANCRQRHALLPCHNKL